MIVYDDRIRPLNTPIVNDIHTQSYFSSVIFLYIAERPERQILRPIRCRLLIFFFQSLSTNDVYTLYF